MQKICLWISTANEYNHRGDLALTGIPNVQKVVDYMLIQTDTFKDNVRHLIKVFGGVKNTRSRLVSKSSSFPKRKSTTWDTASAKMESKRILKRPQPTSKSNEPN